MVLGRRVVPALVGLLLLSCAGRQPRPAQPGPDISVRGELMGSGRAAVSSFVADLQARRTHLLELLWGTDGLPQMPPDRVISDADSEPAWADVVGDPIFFNQVRALADVARIDILRFDNPLGLSAVAWHVYPRAPNGRAFIYHHGHGGHWGTGVGFNVINRLTTEGFAVLAIGMPLTIPADRGWIYTPDGQVLTHLNNHNGFTAVETSGVNTLDWFVGNVSRAIAHLEREFGYNSIDMTGWSGGGWTTHLVAALDPRIRRSYPVAGSLPDDVQAIDPGLTEDPEDFEQLPARPWYSVTPWRTIYALGGLGADRRQVHILNAQDSCCSASNQREHKIGLYAAEIAVALGDAGSFGVRIDNVNQHTVSSATLDFIVADSLSAVTPPAVSGELDRIEVQTAGGWDAEAAFAGGEPFISTGPYSTEAAAEAVIDAALVEVPTPISGLAATMVVNPIFGAPAPNCVGAELAFDDPILDQLLRGERGVTRVLAPADIPVVTAFGNYNTRVRSLAGIECMTSIATFRMQGSPIPSLAPIFGLPLTELHVEGASLTDITGISAVTGLVTLGLSHNKIVDISELSTLTSVTGLFIENNLIVDISAMSSMTALSTLRAGFNDIEDITPIAGLGAFVNADFQSNEITTLPTFTSNALIVLNLNDNRITDLTPLLTLNKLRDLWVRGNLIDCTDQAANLATLQATCVGNGGTVRSECL